MPPVSPDPPALLPPVRPEDLDDEALAFLKKWSGGPIDPKTNPPLLTFAHHPKLADAFSRFNLHVLMGTTLSVRQRQIAIMRTLWLGKAVYAWSSHLRTSLQAGLTPDMYRPIQVGADDPYFSDFERTLVRAVDELVERGKVSPPTLDALRTEWDERQLLDFLFTVGCYVMLGGVMRTTGIEREPELLELAERYGAPDAG